MEDAGGINGEIVAVTDSLAQVQSTDEQTAVTWTDDTAITLTSDGTLADVTVGVCVSAVVTDDVATSVTVTQPDDDGTCSSGFSGMGGQMPEGMEEGEMPDMPSDMATPEDGETPDVPSDMPTQDGGSGEMPDFSSMMSTSGEVTAVDGSTITVTDSDGAESTVTVDDSTTYSVTVDSDSSAIAVGLCALAIGEADSAGTVTATTLTLSQPDDDGSCTTGFGSMGGMSGGRGGMSDGQDSGQQDSQSGSEDSTDA